MISVGKPSYIENQLVEMCWEMHSSSDYRKCIPDEPYVRRMIKAMDANPALCVVVDHDDKHIHGWFILVSETVWYARETVGVIENVYVRPEYRNTLCFLRLLRFVEKVPGFDSIRIGYSTHVYDASRIARYEKMLAKRGYIRNTILFERRDL